MTVNLSPLAGAGQQFLDDSGNVLTGGKLYSYAAGTTTPQVTYTSASGVTAHSNPIILNAAGRVATGEIWLTAGSNYKFVLYTSTDVLIASWDNITGINGTGITSNAINVEYDPAGAGAVATNVQTKLRETVSVMDFGAVGDGIADDTAAFVAAQTASKNVYIPEGTYVINNLRIQNNVNLIGAGKEASILMQGAAGNPAINCLSDVTVGQLLSLNLSNFGVIGHPSATVAAVLVAAFGVYAVYRSSFNFNVTSSFRALEIQAADANNVFYCDFKVNSVLTTDTSVLINGGVYNTFDLFLVACANGRALSEAGFNNTFIRLVADGQIASSSQNSLFIAPAIEEWFGTPLPAEAAFVFTGFNQNLINPTLILNPANSAKVGFAFQPFSGTILNGPRILVDGSALLNPFTGSGNNFTIIGPGQNNCGNKMETIYNNADGNRDLRKVTFVGDCSSFTLNPVPHGGKSTQYLAPSGDFNLTIQNNTDFMIINGSGTIATANVGYGFSGQTSFINGQTLSIWTANAITAFNFVSVVVGVDTSLFPTTLTANQKVTFTYHSVTNKWYPS
jgi:hypothetical protein